MKPLSQLADVEWGSLGHSYGSADDVPDMLRGLASPDEKVRDASYSSIVNSLDHQGVQRWDATARAVPFLIGLVADPKTPDRDCVLHLLGEFAIGDVDGGYLLTGFHIDAIDTPQGTKEYGRFVFDAADRGGANDLAYGAFLRALYLEVAAGLPTYLALVRADDPLLRRSATHLLAWMTHEAPRTTPVLTRALADETHPASRGAHGLALSYATLFHPSLHASTRGLLEDALAQAGDPRERCLLAIALFLHPHPSELVRVTLLDALLSPLPKARDCPWSSSTSGHLLLRRLIGRAPESWHGDVIAAACLYLHEHTTDKHHALHIAEDLLAACFEPLPPNRVPASYDAERPIASGDLDDEQTALLRTFVETPLVWSFGNIRLALNGYGLPTDVGSLETFLAAPRPAGA